MEATGQSREYFFSPCFNVHYMNHASFIYESKLQNLFQRELIFFAYSHAEWQILLNDSSIDFENFITSDWKFQIFSNAFYILTTLSVIIKRISRIFALPYSFEIIIRFLYSYPILKDCDLPEFIMTTVPA